MGCWWIPIRFSKDYIAKRFILWKKPDAKPQALVLECSTIKGSMIDVLRDKLWSVEFEAPFQASWLIISWEPWSYRHKRSLHSHGALPEFSRGTTLISLNGYCVIFWKQIMTTGDNLVFFWFFNVCIVERICDAIIIVHLNDAQGNGLFSRSWALTHSKLHHIRFLKTIW